MSPRPQPSRIRLLAAREAPTIVILQRKRAKLFHVVTVDTDTHLIEQGSWFRGVIHFLHCDVSFDGKFLVYMARGSSGETWSGLCRLPWLKTLAAAETPGISWGGGYFADRERLVTDAWRPDESDGAPVEMPFQLAIKPPGATDGLNIVHARFKRDGFTRAGENRGERQEQIDKHYRVLQIGDDGWINRPSLDHPALKVQYVGHLEDGHNFAFSLDDHPELLREASWATWDSRKTLWVARPGLVEQFTLDDLKRGTPSFSLDVDRFEPPPASRDDS